MGIDNMQDKWIHRFLGLANFVASWSKDPSTKVGAVITDDLCRVVSLGFNGLPRGVNDSTYLTRERKLSRTIHAESNAILFAGRSLEGCWIFVTRPPCSNCAALIIQSGIKHVVYIEPDQEFQRRWNDSLTEAQAMLTEAEVEYFSVASSCIEETPLLYFQLTERKETGWLSSLKSFATKIRSRFTSQPETHQTIL